MPRKLKLNPTRQRHSADEMATDETALHLAWGKQPACGKVNRPTSDRLADVTCRQCRRVADRAFMVQP